MTWTKTKKQKKFETSKDNGFIHTVALSWKVSDWNKLCANVLEVFGLPGQRYEYHTSVDNMYFMFKSEKDKELCTMLLSEHL